MIYYYLNPLVFNKVNCDERNFQGKSKKTVVATDNSLLFFQNLFRATFIIILLIHQEFSQF